MQYFFAGARRLCWSTQDLPLINAINIRWQLRCLGQIEERRQPIADINQLVVVYVSRLQLGRPKRCRGTNGAFPRRILLLKRGIVGLIHSVFVLVISLTPRNGKLDPRFACSPKVGAPLSELNRITVSFSTFFLFKLSTM